jgi:hypothetical protein
MKSSIRFNNDIPAERFIHMAALAEEAVFDQIWVSNDLSWHFAPALTPVSMHPSEIAMVASSLHGSARLMAAGARHISFGPPLGPNPEQAVAALGRKVLPALNEK